MAFFNNDEKELSWLYEGRTKTGERWKRPRQLLRELNYANERLHRFQLKRKAHFRFSRIFSPIYVVNPVTPMKRG